MWDQRYAGDAYLYGTEPNDLVRAEAHRIPKGRVVCLAEGEGRNAVYLAGLGHDVTAVDQSPVGLAKAERLARERGVSLRTVAADLADYERGEAAWDGIVATWAHVPPAIRARLLAAIPRALRPGGVLIYEAYRPAQIALGTGGPKDPSLLPTLPELTAALGALDLVLARDTDREVREGAGHGGTSATVQVVGVRR